MVTMLRAGYTKAEIDEIRSSEAVETSETSTETSEDTPEDTSSETSEETETETDSMEDLNNPLKATIEELQKTIKEMQKFNRENARMPDVEEKAPVDSASDILFNAIIGKEDKDE